MIETVDDLLKELEKHKGKKLMMKDLTKESISFLFEVEEKENTCFLVKSVRDYKE